MKITKTQLRRIIREEKVRLLEASHPPDINAPGWHPNDSEEWARQARSEQEQDWDPAAEKQQFLAAQYAKWEDHWEIDDDIQAEIITSILSKAYDDIEAEWNL
jgi:hypothetical protein